MKSEPDEASIDHLSDRILAGGIDVGTGNIHDGLATWGRKRVAGTDITNI